MKETGYHGTCSKYRNNIESNGFDPARCHYRGDHWLGQGVYFFDDIDKAKWWASSVSYRNGKCGAVVFSASIEALDHEVLDLDDKNQLDVFMQETVRTLKEIEENCLGGMPVFESNNIRAVFFDYYKQQNNVSVIIGTFQKDYAGYLGLKSKADMDLYRKIMHVTGIRFLERQICVSKKECIKSVLVVYNEEDEVI